MYKLSIPMEKNPEGTWQWHFEFKSIVWSADFAALTQRTFCYDVKRVEDIHCWRHIQLKSRHAFWWDLSMYLDLLHLLYSGLFELLNQYIYIYVFRPKQIRRFNFISTNTKALGEYVVLKRVSRLSVFKYVIIIYIIWLHIHLI